jgi:uncharacterized protein YndB with AHSA1/START domain
MLIKILAGLAVLILLFVVVVALRPDHMRVTRSASIAAPPEAVFAQVNNLHQWEFWSPWVKLDPNAKTTYEGPDAGVGAAFTWDGNSKVGAGRMTITESRPNELVRFRLDFAKPLNGTQTAEFTFKPEGGQTTVTWAMFGECNFVGKAMGLLFNCDKMVGTQFEQGLADMKHLTEKNLTEATAKR